MSCYSFLKIFMAGCDLARPSSTHLSCDVIADDRPDDVTTMTSEHIVIVNPLQSCNKQDIGNSLPYPPILVDEKGNSVFPNQTPNFYKLIIGKTKPNEIKLFTYFKICFQSDSKFTKEMENEKRLPEKFVSVTGELEEDDDQNEEEKMEKFFALVKGFQEARNRRRNELEEARNKKKMRNSDDHRESGWVPAFQWEDFTQYIEFRKPPPPPPPKLLFPAGGPNCNVSINKKEETKKLEKHNEGGMLDLKLAL